MLQVLDLSPSVKIIALTFELLTYCYVRLHYGGQLLAQLPCQRELPKKKTMDTATIYLDLEFCVLYSMPMSFHRIRVGHQYSFLPSVILSDIPEETVTLSIFNKVFSSRRTEPESHFGTRVHVKVTLSLSCDEVLRLASKHFNTAENNSGGRFVWYSIIHTLSVQRFFQKTHGRPKLNKLRTSTSSSDERDLVDSSFLSRNKINKAQVGRGR
jgi:hypothetical protein